MPRIHREIHRIDRIGWLRASVLGANDGIVSTASVVLGVAAANATSSAVLVAGVAGLVAGAMSMAAGEYVSVRSQADTEAADLARERAELASDVQAEQRELASIYVKRGLKPDLARQVALQLMEHDALGAHARDELGINSMIAARPVQAALASAASFTAGAAMPLAVAAVIPASILSAAVSATRRANAVVLSPALDGGYTLIGVSKAHPRLYEDIPWSTAAVFQRTVERAAEIDLPVVTVPGWYDVDDAASLAILESELAGEPPFADAFPGAQAPATRAHLMARAVPLRAGSAR